jgi:hypothetical protein
MRFDHPFDHPDDPSGPVGSRLDRQHIRPEQPRSDRADQADAEHPTRSRKVEGSNPSSGSKPQFRGHLWRCRQRGGNRRSFLWVGHRAAGAPDPLRYIGVPPASPLGRPWARVGLGVRASSIAGPLQGVASGVTRKRHSTLGDAELLVDDPQGSLHRLGTEATDAVVKWMVEELQEEQHRHDHRDHGPHE